MDSTAPAAFTMFLALKPRTDRQLRYRLMPHHRVQQLICAFVDHSFYLHKLCALSQSPCIRAFSSFYILLRPLSPLHKRMVRRN